MSAETGGEITPPANLSSPRSQEFNSDMEMDSPMNLIGTDNTNSSIDNAAVSNKIRTSSNKQPKNNGGAKGESIKVYSTARYEHSDLGPYYVYIDNISQDPNARLNAIKIGDLLFRIHPELDSKISNIESIGKNRIRVKFMDITNANKLLSSKVLITHNLQPYIPKFITHKYGIIKGVDLDFTEDYMKNKISYFDMHCKFVVDTVKRMHRKAQDSEGEKKLIPTKTVLVIFKASSLPKYISINHVRIPVEPYEQKVLLCYNCYRYGHLQKQCKSKMRCLSCKGEHDIANCTENAGKKCCFYCDGEHLTNEINKCSEFQRQKSIKKIMTEMNISYWEASKKVPKTTYADVASGTNSNLGTNQKSVPQKNVYTNTMRLSQQHNSQKFSFNTQQYPSTYPQYNPKNIQINSQKRRRPTENKEDDLLMKHNEIIRPINLPSSGGILDKITYKSHLDTRFMEQPFKNLSLQSLVDVILIVVQSLKEKDNFDIQESTVLNILKSIIPIQSNSDDEFF